MWLTSSPGAAAAAGGGVARQPGEMWKEKIARGEKKNQKQNKTKRGNRRNKKQNQNENPRV